ncbi:uncharacterized protein LOC123527975 [Mercenaria mercenaria]|uniref:uncharacterized protein LOC123527975 n=1 Tax=Mercenaria mercenaria TaxID=6596 RepID=UPI00234E9E3F|nr:uncharacterized protein LOC123527975 [Mercenaria mercenaria]
MQILNLLLKWKQKNGSEATFGVLRKRLGKLIKRREGDWIGKVVREGLKSATWELPTDTLQAIPDDRILSFCISTALLPGTFYFFFLELGLSVPAIERADEQYRGFVSRMFELLKLWKQQEANEATLQRLLDTADYVGMNSSLMVQYVRRERTKTELLASWHSTNA